MKHLEFIDDNHFLEEEEKEEQNIFLKSSLYGRKLKGKEIKIDPKFIGFQTKIYLRIKYLK